MKYVKVYWYDHFSCPTWKDEKEIIRWIKEQDTLNETVGEIVYKDERFTALAASKTPDKDYGEIIVIYNCLIKKTERLGGKIGKSKMS